MYVGKEEAQGRKCNCLVRIIRMGRGTVDIVDSQTHVCLNNHSLHFLHVGSPESGAYCPLYLLFLFCFVLFFEIRSHVSHASLELSMKLKITLDFCCFCVHLLIEAQTIVPGLYGTGDQPWGFQHTRQACQQRS